MYIEKNGYLVVYPQELSFLTEDREFSDSLDLAEVFSSNASALEAISQFVNGESKYIVMRYNQTIWIDRDAIQPIQKDCCENISASECCCHHNQESCESLEQQILDRYSMSMYEEEE